MPRLAPKPDPFPSFPPTPEQEAILSLLRSTTSNILINALAGSGKTSTLELLQAHASPPVLCLAFNRRIADEMTKRFLSTTTVRTLNSLGHRIWASTCGGKLSLDPRKSQDLLRAAIDSLPKSSRSAAYDIFWEIISAVSLAKSLGYIPDGGFPAIRRLLSADEFFAHLDEVPSPLLCDLTDTVLLSSIKAAYAGSIDYNDQCYMPALFGGTYPKFPLVLIDEAQDLSPINHEMLSHLKRSRLIAVGDVQQAIYSFRGAATNGMQKLQERFAMISADLTVSFRCPEQVVRNVHWHAPKMKWIKAGGRVARLRNPSASAFLDGSAIICRNNAPLFALAMRLLGSGRSVKVAGSDIGPKLISLLRKLGPEETPQAEALNAIESWRAERLARQSTTANDLADCMRVFAQHGTTLAQSIVYAEHLFKQEGTLHLLTGHKAKGLEWPTVYHLDPFLLSDSDQDRNLRYVIATRALETYYEIETREIRWD